MKQYLDILFLTVLCSCYYFPVTVALVPFVNSKMVVAVVGLLMFLWSRIKRQSFSMRLELLPVILMGLIFSLSSLFSVAYNSTDDFVFVTFFISMCVWLGGAYCVTSFIRLKYGCVALRTVFFYVALACALQCILAVLIDNIPQLRQFVNNVFGISSEYFDENPRLYGIGAAFDTAGIRFSCALLGLGYLIKNELDLIRKSWYIFVFVVIIVVGNMISRSTVIGLSVACFYMILPKRLCINQTLNLGKFFWYICGVLTLILIYNLIEYMYYTLPNVRQSIDYGFEGFFNLFRTGEFSTHSSDLLLDNIFSIYPDNTKTWVIGDGYFADPYNPELFYKGTDMGYIRYIFYGGLVGLFFILGYFVCCTYMLCRRERHLNLFFILLLIIQLIVWIKIPTDIFCYYALLLLADKNSSEIKYDLNL